MRIVACLAGIAILAVTVSCQRAAKQEAAAHMKMPAVAEGWEASWHNSQVPPA